MYVIMASTYNFLDDEPGGLPPGSPPTCASFLLPFPVGVNFSFLSKVRGPMVIDPDNDFVIYWNGLLPYLLILPASMASPLCTQNSTKGYRLSFLA